MTYSQQTTKPIYPPKAICASAPKYCTCGPTVLQQQTTKPIYPPKAICASAPKYCTCGPTVLQQQENEHSVHPTCAERTCGCASRIPHAHNRCGNVRHPSDIHGCRRRRCGHTTSHCQQPPLSSSSVYLVMPTRRNRCCRKKKCEDSPDEDSSDEDSSDSSDTKVHYKPPPGKPPGGRGGGGLGNFNLNVPVNVNRSGGSGGAGGIACIACEGGDLAACEACDFGL